MNNVNIHRLLTTGVEKTNDETLSQGCSCSYINGHSHCSLL